MEKAAHPRITLTSKQLGIFYVLSMVASGCNFLFYPIMARLVSPSVFGEIQFFTIAIFQASMLFLSLNVITIILTNKYRAKPSLMSAKISALSSLFNVVTIATAIAISLLLFIHNNTFAFSNPHAFALLAAAIISMVPLTISMGKLQGQDRYVASGVLNVAASLVKLLAAALLVLAGWGAAGALMGIIVGQLSVVFWLLYQRRVQCSEVASVSLRGIKSLVADRHLVLLVGFCSIAVNVVTALDTLIAKGVLSPYQAGLFAGIATLSKIIIFIVSPLMWAIIPFSTKKTHDSQRMADRMTLIAIALCVLLIALFQLLGKDIIMLLLGSRYLDMYPLLVMATVAMAILAIAAITNVRLAAQEHFAAMVWQAFIICAVTAGGFILGERNIHSILLSQLLGGSIGMLYYIAYRIRMEVSKWQRAK